MDLVFAATWHRLFFWGIAAIVLIPLLNIPPMFTPSAWGQTMVFRLLIIPLLLLFVWQLIKTRQLSSLLPHGPGKLPWTLLYAWGGVVLLATTLSIDPVRSFWDDPNRSWGVLNFLLYVAFAISLFLIARQKEWGKLWYVLLGTGTILSLFAVFQNFGLILEAEARPSATLGNPLFLAMTLAPLAIMGMALFLQEKRIRWRWAIAGAISLLLIATFLTLSRATFLGLAVGAVFFFLSARPMQNTISKGVILALVLAGALLVWYANTTAAMPDILRSLPNGETFWNRLSLEQAVGDARFAAWNIAIRAAAEKPFFGYGPSNTSLALDRFYDPTLGPINDSIGWWDSSHNIFLDIFVETGLAGLAAFLAFLGTLFWKLQQAKRKHPEIRLRATGVQAALIAYLTNGLFSFNTFATFLVFFVLIAYALYLISRTTATQREPSPARIVSPSFLQRGIFGVLVLGAIWFLGQHTLLPLWHNGAMNHALILAESGQCRQAIQHAESISSSHPSLRFHVPAQHANVLRACLPSGTEDPETRALLSLKAAHLLSEAASARPSYSRTHLAKMDYLSIVLTYAKESEQTKAIGKDAEAAFQKARALSPRRETLYEKGSRVARQLAQYEHAIERADHCLAYNPLATTCLWEKVLAYTELEDFPAADEALEQLRAKRALTFEEANQLALLYQEQGNYERLVMPYSRLVTITENPEYAESLALAYKQLGNWDGAHEATLFMLQWDPTLRDQVEKFLRPIKRTLQQECARGIASSCWRLSLVELTLHNKQASLLTKRQADQLGFPVTSREALRDLVLVHLANHDTSGLLAEYEQFSHIQDLPVGALITLGEWYERHKQREKAKELLEIVQTINPEG